MLQSLANLFKIADLKKKILFTLGIIVIYRIGAYPHRASTARN